MNRRPFAPSMTLAVDAKLDNAGGVLMHARNRRVGHLSGRDAQSATCRVRLIRPYGAF